MSHLETYLVGYPELVPDKSAPEEPPVYDTQNEALLDFGDMKNRAVSNLMSFVNATRTISVATLVFSKEFLEVN